MVYVNVNSKSEIWDHNDLIYLYKVAISNKLISMRNIISKWY